MKELNIQDHLIELMKELCFEKKEVAYKIRLILSTFKFHLRMIYPTLLQKTITALGAKFLNLLEEIPEILPY